MQNDLTATSEMQIRKPVGEVFEALINPEVTSRFWFTRGSARLETDRDVEWEWGQFGVQAAISVKEVQQDRLIRFQWPADEEGTVMRNVEIAFESVSEEKTFVRVVESGFDNEADLLIKLIAGQTEGWALVLSGMKAWLEHGIELNLVADHKPNES